MPELVDDSIVRAQYPNILETSSRLKTHEDQNLYGRSRGGRKFYGEAPVAFLDLELSQESSTMTWETFRKPKIPLYTQFQLSS